MVGKHLKSVKTHMLMVYSSLCGLFGFCVWCTQGWDGMGSFYKTSWQPGKGRGRYRFTDWKKKSSDNVWASRLNTQTESGSVSDATWKNVHGNTDTLIGQRPLSMNMHIIFTCVGGIKRLVRVIWGMSAMLSLPALFFSFFLSVRHKHPYWYLLEAPGALWSAT